MTGTNSIWGIRRPGAWRLPTLWLVAAVSSASFGQTTNLAAVPPAVPDIGPSLLRVFGALALVLALFFGAVWFLQRSQRFVWRRGAVSKLEVLEVRSLGGKQAIYVVGYEQERLLIAASPAGISLVSHLPPATEKPAAEAAPAVVSFTQTLQSLLRRT